MAFCATAAGIVLEIGRKLRAPEDEEPGVSTYTAEWGRDRALAAWLLAGAIAAGLTLILSFGWFSVISLSAVGISSVWATLQFQREPSSKSAKWFEPVSALWALVVFVSFALRGVS